MNIKKPMPLLLIEDDIEECRKFKVCANSRTDVRFVGMTASSTEGIQFVKDRLPEGVILDLELNKGSGSGIQFLTELRNVELTLRPLIFITTNAPSEIVHNDARNNGADLIFYKRKADYSADMVINHMLTLRKSLYSIRGNVLPVDMQTLETPQEFEERISKRITAELNLIGINPKYTGRSYLHDSISLLLIQEKGEGESVIYQVAKNYKGSYGAIIRAMQTAINSAWKNSCIEDLETYYTAQVDVRTGVPSPTQFIHYYADKIRGTI
jgi:DNA-binding NarL/FixJ family response regulator